MEEEQQLTKALTDAPSFIMEITLMQGIKQYFSCLRHSRGHNPEGSPIDLEVLLLLKLILVSVENPISTLHSIGIIIIGDEIAINARFLCIVLSTCRSRINNSMKHIGWNLVNHTNPEKCELLRPLVDRKDARNWSFRSLPQTSPVYMFVHENPQIQLRASASDSMQDIPLPLILDSGSEQKDMTAPHGTDSYQ